MVVGEAWGANEAQQHQPFVGESGKELSRMLKEAGIDESACFFTNVVNARPDNNDFTKFLIPNELAKKNKAGAVKRVFPNNQLHQGLEALHAEIATIRPRMILALGNWPLWALTPHANVATKKGYRVPAGIDSWRGSQLWYDDGGLNTPSIPLLPTYHPAGVLRNWPWRHLAVHDFRRAAKHLAGAKPWTDDRVLDWNLSPGVYDVRRWVDRFLSWPDKTLELVLDLETYAGKIHILGLRDKNSCLVVPFMHVNKAGTQPFYSRNDFISIYSNLRRLLTDPRVHLVGQNLIYDAQYLERYFCYTPKISFDTMVAQYICFPAERKGLDFISSIYCRYYRYWKEERKESLDNESTEDGCHYNALDLEYTYENWKVLKQLLAHFKKTHLFEDRVELMHILLDMMRHGVLVDLKRKTSMRDELEFEMGALAAWLEGAIPDNLKPPITKTSKSPWYDSVTKQKHLFYTTLKLRPVFDRKTGKPTLNKEAFETLIELYPHFTALFGALTIRRSMRTIKNNVLAKRTGPDGRIRCAYGPAATASMRLNSTEDVFGDGCNLQNIVRDRDTDITLFNAVEELA
jgi:DNA polymerase